MTPFVAGAAIESVLVLGGGKVTNALCAALRAANVPVTQWSRARGGEPVPAQICIIAVSDRAIADVAARIMAQPHASETTLVHCAGAFAADAPFVALSPRPHGVGLLHPLRAIAGDEKNFAATIFAVGGDGVGIAAARAIVALLGGQPLEVPRASMALYHAALVIVANDSLALLDTSIALLGQVGLAPDAATRALCALMRSAIDNVERLGVAAALTGPVVRGDAQIVADHLAALGAVAPDVVPLYKLLAQKLLQIASRNDASNANAADQRAALAALLES